MKLREEIFNFEGTPSSGHETAHKGLLMRMCSILHQYSPHGIAGVRKAAISAHMESFQRGFETGQEQRERIELGVLDPARCESVTILPSGAQIWLEVAESVASLQIKASGRSNATSISWVVREDSGSREDFEHKVQKLRDAINPLQSIYDRTVIRTVELLDRLADQPRPFQMKAAQAALSLGKDVVAAIKAIEGLKIEGVYPGSANQVVQLLAGHEVVDIYFANGQISTDRPANFCNLRIAIGPSNDVRVRLSNLMRGRVQAYLSQDACTSHGGVGETALRLSRAFAEQLQSSRLRPQSQLEQLADQDPSRSWCLSEGDGIGLDMPHGRDVAGNLAYDNAGLLVKEYRKIKPAPPYQLTVQYNGLGMCLASLEDQESKTSLLLTVSSKGISGIVASAPMLSDPTRSEQFEWFGGVERSVPILATQELSVLLRLFQSFSVDRMTAQSRSIHDSLLVHFIRNVVLKSQIEAA
jgi:hypothetical protein